MHQANSDDIEGEQLESNESTQLGLINLDDANYLIILQNNPENCSESFTIEQYIIVIPKICECSHVKVKKLTNTNINCQQNELPRNTSKRLSGNELTNRKNSLVNSHRTNDTGNYIPNEDDLEMCSDETDHKERTHINGWEEILACKCMYIQFSSSSIAQSHIIIYVITNKKKYYHYSFILSKRYTIYCFEVVKDTSSPLLIYSHITFD